MLFNWATDNPLSSEITFTCLWWYFWVITYHKCCPTPCWLRANLFLWSHYYICILGAGRNRQIQKNVSYTVSSLHKNAEGKASFERWSAGTSQYTFLHKNRFLVLAHFEMWEHTNSFQQHVSYITYFFKELLMHALGPISLMRRTFPVWKFEIIFLHATC